MNPLTTKFPIQVTTDRVLITSDEQFQDFIDKYNGKTTMFYSLYDVHKKEEDDNCGCSVRKYHSCYTRNLNKICYDIDSVNSGPTAIKMHKYLLEKNLKHLILFSGQKGFHIYIFTENYNNLKNQKNTLLNSHNHFIKDMKLDIQMDAGKSDVDKLLIGDINRLMRIPNTLHMESKLYCIPVTTEDLLLGRNYIREKAKKQNFKYTIYGEKLLDLSEFDTASAEEPIITFKFHENLRIEVSVDKQEILNQLTPCLQNILLQPYVHWRERFYVIRYLQHIGYSNGELDLVLKQFLEGKKHPEKGHDNFEHYLKEKQNKYVMRNKSLFSCKQIKREGLCPVVSLCKEIQERPIYM